MGLKYFKTLDDFDFNGKLVLLRCDLNSDVRSGKVIMSDRIKESSKTIAELKRKKARVVILSHQGRPGKKDFVSLSQHSRLLNKFTPIKFVKDIIGKKSSEEISKLKKGKAILLDNVRKLDEEFSLGKNILTNFFSERFEIYINDAFSVSHRKQSSITEIPKFIRDKGIGRTMEKELKALEKLDFRNCLYILGGAKPDDNIKLLGKKKIIATGFFDHLCLVAKGYKLGKQDNFIQEYSKLISKFRLKLKKVKTSVDFAIRKNKKLEFVGLKDLPLNYRLYDLGPKTIKGIEAEIKRSKCIFMKGPAGFFQEKEFSNGTVGILKTLARCKGKVILGGGHLNTALEKYKINKKSFERISLAGGALISYFAGEKLPGLEVLKNKRENGKKI